MQHKHQLIKMLLHSLDPCKIGTFQIVGAKQQQQLPIIPSI